MPDRHNLLLWEGNGACRIPADIYGSYALFGKIARKVLDSYVQESILAEESWRSRFPAMEDVRRFLDEGGPARIESISETMERRVSENGKAEIFEYRFRNESKTLHSSYVKKK
jgi:hypothetical protein